MIFTKMQGTGNDFIIIEDFSFNINVEEECPLAEKLCNRNYSIGADGIIIIRKSDVADVKMTIINSDGSRATMCGNGIRCVAKYVYHKRIVNKTDILVQTDDGVKSIDILFDKKDEIIRVNMGKPEVFSINNKNLINTSIKINQKQYVLSSAFLGVLHTVLFLSDNDKLDIIRDGKIIEKCSLFKNGTNVNFVNVIDSTNLSINTWEKGAGWTLACGTGASASAFIARLLRKCDPLSKEIFIELRGGKVSIEFIGDNVYLKGPANFIYTGEIFL